MQGEAKIPFTTGILIGIGETRLERIESLLALREVHLEFGHIQEIIIQNFRAKPGTKMKNSPDPDLNGNAMDPLGSQDNFRIGNEHTGSS